MRWFKHLVTSSTDEKLSALRDAYGLEGYGFWWAVVEIVAEKVDENERTFAEFSPKKWGDLLGISPKKFRTLTEFCANSGNFPGNSPLFLAEFSEKLVRIDMPNILKYRDEWTARKTKTRESLGSNSGPSRARVPETDPETEENKNTPPPPCGGRGVVSAPLPAAKSGPPDDPGGTPAIEPVDDPGAHSEPPATPPEGMDMGFQEFLAAYPAAHQQPVGGAINAWKALARQRALPGLPRMLDAITGWEASEQWRKDDGRYIPSAENFLRKRLWLGTSPRASPEQDISAAWERLKKLENGNSIIRIPA